MSASITPISAARDTAPVHLGEHGKRLWKSVQRDHDITDGAGLALLTRACECQDRLAQVRAQLATDGLLVAGYKKQPRPHPLLAVESETTRLQLAAIRALGLEID